VPFSEIFDPAALIWSTLSKSTVVAVPGMVGARAKHLQCLRRLVDDDGWIGTLREEAENERMHLMTLFGIARPAALERLLIVLAKWISALASLVGAWSRVERRTVSWATSRKRLTHRCLLRRPSTPT